MPSTAMSGDSQKKSKDLQPIYTAQFKGSMVTVNMYPAPTVLTAHINDRQMRSPEAEATGMLTVDRLQFTCKYNF